MYSKLLLSFLFISSSMGAFAGVKPEPINENSKEQAQYIFLMAEHHEHKDGHDHEGHDHHEMEGAFSCDTQASATTQESAVANY